MNAFSISAAAPEQLAAEIAASGAEVVGVDRSAEMIEEARQEISSTCASKSATLVNCHLQHEFDAVFSNAALHWIPDAEPVVAGIVPRAKATAEDLWPNSAAKEMCAKW